MSRQFDRGMTATKVIELIGDLLDAKRISRAEAQVIYDLIWHPEFPRSLCERHEDGVIAVAIVEASNGSPQSKT